MTDIPDEWVEQAAHPQKVPEHYELWKAAVADRDEAIRLMSELMLRTPSIGEDKDGFVAGYVLPTGPLHRIAAYLTQHGQSFPQVRHYAEMKAESAAVADDIRAQALRDAANAYPTMLRDMVSRGSVADWLRERALREEQGTV